MANSIHESQIYEWTVFKSIFYIQEARPGFGLVWLLPSDGEKQSGFGFNADIDFPVRFASIRPESLNASDTSLVVYHNLHT